MTNLTTRAQQPCVCLTIHFAKSSAFLFGALTETVGIVLNLQRDRELLCCGKSPQQ